MTRFRSLLCALALLLGVGQAHLAFAQAPGKVLLIGIDGTRPDALGNANTPNFDSLKPGGAYTDNAITGNISFSGPGWSSMLTGVWCDKHGVLSNEFINPNFDQYPAIDGYIEAADENNRTVVIAHWDKIVTEIMKHADVRNITTTDEEVTSLAIDELEKDEVADFLFLHYDDVDYAGHDCCYAPDNPDYLAGIEKVDGLIGPVIEALKGRPNFAAENWLILSSTDHGGGGFIPDQHGADVPEDRTIYVLANAQLDGVSSESGDGRSGSKPRCKGCKVERNASVQEKPACRGCKVPSGRDRDPQAFLNISAQIIDIAATVLDWLDIPIRPEWGIEGQVLPIPGVARKAPPYRNQQPIAECAIPGDVWDAGKPLFPLPGGADVYENNPI